MNSLSRFNPGQFLPRCLPALLLLLTFSAQAQNQYIGEIKMFAGNFPPRDWALCDGQLLPIAQNQALFSILGTTYGGDGVTTFALPDLRGRFPMHMGQSPGLTPHYEGEKSGSETVTLTTQQMPMHNHVATATLAVDSTVGTTDQPKGAFPARNASATPQYGSQANAVGQATGVNVQVGIAGGNQPLSIMPPYQTVCFIIALTGIFPSRN